jgi:hypothetical protein
MAQIQTSTCAVTNGSATVVAAADNDWSQAVAPLMFGVNNVWYNVIGSAVFVDPNWQITLSVPYQGADDAAAVYAIQRDFEALFGFPLFAPGDTQIAALLNRFVVTLAGMLAGVTLPVGELAGAISIPHQKVIAGTDIGASTVPIVFSPALSATPIYVGTPAMVKSDPAEDNVGVASIDSISETGYNVNLTSGAIAGQILINTYIPAL